MQLIFEDALLEFLRFNKEKVYLFILATKIYNCLGKLMRFPKFLIATLNYAMVEFQRQ